MKRKSPGAAQGLTGSRLQIPTSRGSLRTTTRAPGFTLIELLVVIAVMAILAALVIPITGAVSRNRIRSKARAELERVATGIELYKAKMGHYPPDNPGNPATNQLYFELLGTTFTNGVYTTLDGSALVKASDLGTVFGGSPARVGGFMNTSQGTGGDEGRQAQRFLNNIKPDETALISSPAGDTVRIFIAGVPAPAGVLNAFNYVSSSPTNNPNFYDLWVDVLINGKTNRLSNWNKEPIIFP
ncbi:MAG TPA: prepilin-type N-terminal cleavage/methylation domain-containing protein [Verrucomicrobiae bacterium]|nr:prepilin-type N-terminal cleavage/methylation domain-containing protein [Verrucomicrobiae bacterium]